MEFRINFVTYKGTYRSIMSDKLNVPSIDGRRTILSNAMALMLPLENGVVETSENGVSSYWAISEGMLHFENNEATILVDSCINVKEINLQSEEKIIKSNEKRLENSQSEADIRHAKVILSRAANRLDAAGKYNKK